MKWLFGTIALLALGLYLELNLLVYAMYVLLGVLLINRFYTRAWVGAIDARRFGGDEVFEIGSQVDIKVAVQNTGTLTVPWMILEDALSRDALTQMPQRIKSQGGRVALTRLPAGHTHVMAYKVQFLMRGYYQIGPLLVETGDVFGLHRRFRVMTEPNFALVMPRVLPLVGYNLASRRPIGEIRLAHRLFEDPTRIAGVRPYQHGDPLNRIHWRASARTGQWQSRQCESSCVVGATFLLDFHSRSFTGPRAVVSAELAIVTIASLANSVYLMGQQIGFISNGRDAADRIREEGWRADFFTRNDAMRRASNPRENTRLRPIIIKPGRGEDHFSTILATMARLEHTDGLDIAVTADDAAARISRDTTVVAVLGTVTLEIAAALGDIKRRGLPVSAIVVSLGMEAVPDWARPPEWAEMLLSRGLIFVLSTARSQSVICALKRLFDDMIGKPQQTAADFMVIALSPILIMCMVGSLCFFLIEVFYKGPLDGLARWVMFWFVIAVVLIPRIAIEKTSEHAGVYGLALAATVWLVLVRTSPSLFFSMVLLAIVWFCANKLVWDCTFIDDEEDSSGQGLLQKAPHETEAKAESKIKKKKRIASSSPGRWVVYFSVLALPLFGIGQVLLPKDASGSRRWGLAFLVVYMAAALGLLVTTSFLGLRRYLRQRYMKMPVSIALAWVKFGGGIALLVIVGALFVPRPGGNAFWDAAKRQIDYRLHQASEYASGRNPHGEGEGKAGDESGAKIGEKRADGDAGPPEKSPSGPPQPGQGAPAPGPKRGPTPVDPALHLYSMMRLALISVAAGLVCWWLVRSRHVLLEMLRSVGVAIRDFFRQLFDMMPARKPVRPAGLEAPRRQGRPLAEFKNPFFSEKDSLRPPEEIILYTYDALQAWTREQGVEPRPEQTAREFCEESGERLPELVSSLRQLSFLYAHAAFGEHLPREYDLEPLKEIWRRLTLQ